MLSMPPATTSDASPARIAWSASMTALSPEPQTLLTVSAPTESGKAGEDRRLSGGILAQPGRDDVAHDDFG